MRNRSFTRFEIVTLLTLDIFRRPILRAQEICRCSGSSEQGKDQKIAIAERNILIFQLHVKGFRHAQ